MRDTDTPTTDRLFKFLVRARDAADGCVTEPDEDTAVLHAMGFVEPHASADGTFWVVITDSGRALADAWEKERAR